MADRVTGWQNTEGFADDESAVTVLAAVTVCVIDGEVLAVRFPDPL